MGDTAPSFSDCARGDRQAIVDPDAQTIDADPQSIVDAASNEVTDPQAQSAAVEP